MIIHLACTSNIVKHKEGNEDVQMGEVLDLPHETSRKRLPIFEGESSKMCINFVEDDAVSVTLLRLGFRCQKNLPFLVK